MWPFKKKSEQSDLEPVQLGRAETIVNPPVDLNTPVTNPALKATIAEPGNSMVKGSRRTLWLELNRANFLVIFNTSGVKITPGSTEGQATFESGGHIKVLTCRDPEGKLLLPAFTDWDEVNAFSRDEQIATLVMPSQQLWEFALDNGHEGMVINPGGKPFPLTREHLQDLKIEA